MSPEPIVLTATEEGYTATFTWPGGDMREPVTWQLTGTCHARELSTVNVQEALGLALFGRPFIEHRRRVHELVEGMVAQQRRPSRITPDFLADVVAVHEADGIGGAVEKYGVSERTVRRWLAQARDEGLR
jgi:hypothetical protein